MYFTGINLPYTIFTEHMCTRINLPLFIIVDYRQPKYPFTFSSTKHYAGIKNNKHYLCKQVHKDIQNLTRGKKKGILLKLESLYTAIYY